jgi:hypothetical protein
MRAVLLLALAALAACSTRRTEEPTGGFSVSDVVGDWSATLHEQNNSDVTGSVKAQSALAAAGITITISGAQSGAHHPWHVHRGTCASTGAIVGDATAYPALHVGSDGAASAAATLGVALNEGERYSVNVHRSAAEMNVIISCGELKN